MRNNMLAALGAVALLGAFVYSSSLSAQQAQADVGKSTVIMKKVEAGAHIWLAEGGTAIGFSCTLTSTLWQFSSHPALQRDGRVPLAVPV